MSSRCQIRRGHVTAKHMGVCVSKNSDDSQSWKLSKLSSFEIYECLHDRVPFLRQSQDQRKGRKHLAVKRQQTSLRATKILSFGYKNMNANRIRVKSSRISPASLLTWTDFPRERCFFYCVIWNCFRLHRRQCRRRTVSCCSRDRFS